MEIGAGSFSFSVPRAPSIELEVVSFEGVEAISRPFSYRVTLATSSPTEAVLGELLGAPAALTLNATAARTLRGVLRSVEWRGLDPTPSRRSNRFAVELVHPLALLQTTRRSRVFQELSVQSIVGRVLDEWGLAHRWSLALAHDPWPYCVQYEESDFDFLARILASEGIFYFFDDDALPDDDVAPAIVLGDSHYAYAVDPQRVLLSRGDESGALTRTGETVERLTSRVALAATSVELRDYNPMNARLDVVASTRLDAAPRGTDAHRMREYLPARPLGIGHDDAAARIALDGHRRDAVHLAGVTGCRRIRPGWRFRVDEREGLPDDGELVTTTVRVTGQDASSGASARERVFQALFEAVPASVARVPERPAPRLHPGVETAFVIGPDAEEIHTDSVGRVRAKLRWGVSEADPEACTCWLRVAQGWAGPSHGLFLLPRVGMEVLISFLGGDVNRPIVTGCMPNSSNVAPFATPGDATKSGLVSRSTPGGGGSSEITIEDAAGREKVLIRSQLDLEEVAPRDHLVRVGGDQRVAVTRDRHDEVRGKSSRHVAGDSSETVVGAMETLAAGSRSVVVQGGARAEYQSGLAVRVTGEASRDVRGDVRERVGGLAETVYEREAMVRHEGSALVVVGQPEAPRTFTVHVEGAAITEASHGIELVSEKSIRLVCGESILVIGPDSIQLSSPKVRIDGPTIEVVGDAFQVKSEKVARIEGQKVFVLSSGASVALTADAKIDGGKVKLKSPPDSSDGPEAAAPRPPATFIRLADQDGEPIAGARFVVALADGTERMGVLDGDGRATLIDVEGAAEVSFPDYPDWESA